MAAYNSLFDRLSSSKPDVTNVAPATEVLLAPEQLGGGGAGLSGLENQILASDRGVDANR